MANLGPLYQNQTYSNLLQVDGGLTAELKPVLDGDGNASGLTLSLTGVGISGLVADSASNLYAGTAGALPYQVNTNVTGFVTAGTPGQFLLSNGASAPVWTTVTPSTIGALASNGSNSMTGNLSMGSNKIVNLLTPVSGTDAATKAYVDSIATGLQVKSACRLATTTNLTTLTGAATVDGVVVNTGDRVLVRAQTNPAENGIYVANVSTSPLGVWTRATDADTWAEIVGAATFITAGSTLANTTWVSNVAPGGTLDTTPITFVLFGASTAYTAGTGLSLVGSQFSLTTPVSLANGGTGATTLTGYVKGNGTSAMTAVASIPNTDVSGLGTLSTQNANAVTLTGGTINGTPVGATTASTGAFTDLTASGTVNFRDYITVDPLVAAYFTTPRVWDSSKTHWYRITPSELTDNRYVTLPLLGTNDTFVFENHAQTLTNKTLTSPVVNGGSISTTTTQTNWDAAYADRLKWDGGSAGLNDITGRASLGLGNISTINTTGSTTNFLRADGAWAAPASGGGSTYINVTQAPYNASTAAADNSAAFNAALATGNIVYVPPGTYNFTSTINILNASLYGSGWNTTLQFNGTSATTPLIAAGRTVSIKDIRLRFSPSRVTGSETAGQRVLLQTNYNDGTINWGLQRGSLIENVQFDNCGTAIYAQPPGDAGPFSVTFDTCEFRWFSYRGVDLNEPNSTGCLFNNLYFGAGGREISLPGTLVSGQAYLITQVGTINWSAIGAQSVSTQAEYMGLPFTYNGAAITGSGGLVQSSCDSIFVLTGPMSECSINQCNFEWSIFRTNAAYFSKVQGITATAIHFERAIPATNGLSILKLDSCSADINALSMINTPFTASNIALVDIASSINYGGVTNPATANYYNFGIFNTLGCCKYSTNGALDNPGLVVFRRSVNDGPVYVDLGNYEWNTYYADANFWRSFPTSGYLIFISNGNNPAAPSRTFTSPLDLAAPGSTGGGASILIPGSFSSTIPIYAFWFNGNCGIGNPASGIGNLISGGTEITRWSTSGYQVNNLAGTGNRAVYSTASGLLTNTSSDSSLKENVLPITDGLAKVNQLNGVSFTWKDTELYGDQREIGFIAQEVEAIIPEVIGVNSDDTLSLDYPKLTALLVEAIKELSAKVVALENNNG